MFMKNANKITLAQNKYWRKFFKTTNIYYFLQPISFISGLFSLATVNTSLDVIASEFVQKNQNKINIDFTTRLLPV